MTSALRLLLYPFALMYGMVIMVRNFFFDFGILKSARFEIPVVLVGNLSTGGTGKTPHVEMLIRLLKAKYKVATLSRGYGRRTKGFREVDSHSSAWEAGDEPLIYKSRHPDITVTVCENRANGIRTIMQQHPEVEVIIMDDGYQHRSVKPGYAVLLTPWQTPFFKDHLLPAGNLRESASGCRRADCVVVTRTPANSSAIERMDFAKRIAAAGGEQIYFSSIGYQHPQPVFPDSAPPFPDGSLKPVVFAGIADPGEFISYIRTTYGEPDLHLFGDHHDFSEKDLEDLFERYQVRMISDKNSVLITTEKDAMRLRTTAVPGALKQLPLYFIPIDVVLQSTELSLESRILNYVAENKRNR